MEPIAIEMDIISITVMATLKAEEDKYIIGYTYNWRFVTLKTTNRLHHAGKPDAKL